MRKLIISSIFILTATISFSQETRIDTLRTEEISVVKPYTPSISDAFKIKSNPVIDTLSKIKKEKVNYSIFSIPVASTFTPSKGKAKGITRAPKEQLYDNYISAGFGNYTSPLFEAYLHTGDPRHNDFGVFINHHSSEGGIKDLQLNDNFANTRIDAFYEQFDKYYNWQINAGVQRKLFNYYGIPTNVQFDETVVNSIDEKQIYKNIYVGGNVSFEDSFFKGATAELMNFSDNYDSNEFRFTVKPKLEFPISTEFINSEFLVDVIKGKFEQNYQNSNAIDYSFLNLGFSPSFEVLRENLTVNLGAKIYYSSDLDNKTNKFYAYPNVTASLKVVDEVFILVAGATGDLIQNNYQDFSNENPYVSPTLNILQTDKQYKAFVGAKGKLASNVSYNFEISHTNENDKPLFIQNQTKTNGSLDVSQGYEAGNSFNVIYDNIKTLGFSGEVAIDVSKEFNFGGSINYSNYTTETALEAWNLPSIKASINANYLNKNWFAGAKLFFNGETKDYIIPYGLSNTEGNIIENNSYVDLNLNGGYMFSDRLTAFAKINNIFADNYEPFVNYQVQSLQILAGITYKFDL
ncbi:TonB-dependent receptor [Lutibacter citreus]|uniref:TonB-dependent receptor n=1 Tax=Lutibacter citreus TaxID=2138210 RepID=UPI000DBE9A88|nr:TonB-dependent receptor [Lutibacter citreus]